MLRDHLDQGGDAAWRAALRVIEHALPKAHEFGMPLEAAVMPTEEELEQAFNEWQRIRANNGTASQIERKKSEAKTDGG